MIFQIHLSNVSFQNFCSAIVRPAWSYLCCCASLVIFCHVEGSWPFRNWRPLNLADMSNKARSLRICWIEFNNMCQIVSHFAIWTTVIGSLFRVPGHKYGKACNCLLVSYLKLRACCRFPADCQKQVKSLSW